MKKSVWFDMDGTLIDFAQGDLDRALKLMHVPEYYRGLPLMISNVVDVIDELLHEKVEVNIISGIPDRVCHSQYIPFYGEEYDKYYESVKAIKKAEIDKHVGKVRYTHCLFMPAGVSKALKVMELLSLRSLENTILVDDMISYREEWSHYGGSVVNASLSTHDWYRQLRLEVSKLLEKEEK